jgi:hypothetical protein
VAPWVPAFAGTSGIDIVQSYRDML